MGVSGIFVLAEGILIPIIYYCFFSILNSMYFQIMHGVATLSIMSYFCFYGVAEIIMPMLMMEVRVSYHIIVVLPKTYSLYSSVGNAMLTKSFSYCEINLFGAFLGTLPRITLLDIDDQSRVYGSSSIHVRKCN